MRIWKWQNNSSSMWDACHIWTLLNDLALQEYSPCSSVQGTQIFLCPKLMSCWSIHISDRMVFFFGTVKPLLGHISKLQRQPYFTNCSLVLRETRIYIISASLKQIQVLSLSSGNFLSLSCHYVKGLTILYTYTPKVLVKKFNISVDYFQCEKFIVIFFYCHAKIQTCISEKIERKKFVHDTDT